VYVNVEMTRSTRPVVSSGSRAAVGAQTNVSRCAPPEGVARELLCDLDVDACVLAPHVDVPERRRVALDADDQPLAARDVGGQLRQRRRLRGDSCPGGRAVGCADPNAAATTATRATPAVARMILFILQLLPRW
jgi:hypothetical protein